MQRGKNMSMAERFRTARKMAGLRYPTIVADWVEKGCLAPKEVDDTILKLAKDYGVSANWLLFGQSDLTDEEFADLESKFAESSISKEDAQRVVLMLDMLPKKEMQHA
jgi:hypothetical protein